MPTQPLMGVAGEEPIAMPLPRSLSVLETWGFGLTGHLSWLFSVPTIAVALGPSAIFVLLPAVILGIWYQRIKDIRGFSVTKATLVFFIKSLSTDS